MKWLVVVFFLKYIYTLISKLLKWVESNYTLGYTLWNLIGFSGVALSARRIRNCSFTIGHLAEALLAVTLWGHRHSRLYLGQCWSRSMWGSKEAIWKIWRNGSFSRCESNLFTRSNYTQPFISQTQLRKIRQKEWLLLPSDGWSLNHCRNILCTQCWCFISLLNFPLYKSVMAVTQHRFNLCWPMGYIQKLSSLPWYVEMYH